MRTIIERKPFSTHPDDWYLEVVLAKIEWGHTEYVTWEYNKRTSYYSNGHYFETIGEAAEDFERR